jgi:FAD/FMN-containing dehydrogenase
MDVRQAPDAALLAELRETLGPSGWLAGDDADRYLTDFRKLYRGRTPLVARPASTAEVAALVRTCAAARVALVPQGGNTSYCGAATPDDSGREIVLSLERMRTIRKIDPLGGSLVAEAGCTLASVREAAATVGRRFALSLGSEGSCQIGGNVSTNAGGTAVLRHGMMRELVLGLEVVLPDGQVLDQLRTLRKDNTGYDVKQLFIGAEGTLGIVTAAALKIGPAATDAATALVAVDDIAAAVELLGRVKDAFGDLVETFEYMPAIATALAAAHVPGVPQPFEVAHPAYVLIELPLPRALGGLRDALVDFLGAELEAGRIRDARVAQSLMQAESFWFLREQIPAAQTREGASLKHDLSLPIASLARFVTLADALVAQLVPGGRVVGYGHVGDGNLHYNVSPAAGTGKHSASEDAFLATAERLRRALHDLVAELGGSFSAEHGIGRLKVGELERYEDPVALDVMRRIKQALDPDALLNPGKVLR